MKKLPKDVDFFYPSEWTRVIEWHKHHSRNMGRRHLVRAIHKGIRQGAKREMIASLG